MHIHEFAKKTPEKPAIIMAGSGETITYKQLDERSNQGAQYFRDKGLKVGDHIAFLLENSPRFYEICWAAQRAGLYYTAISSRLTADEAAYIINDCGARVFITSNYKSELAGQLLERMPNVEERLMIDGALPGYQSFEEVIGAYPKAPLPDECEGSDMLYSSGTTGRPKGIKPTEIGDPVGTPDNLYSMLKNQYHVTENTIYLSPAPLYHAAPLRYNMRTQRFGATCIIMEHFDAEEYLRLVEKYKITHSQLVPTMFVRMLKLPEEVRNKYDVSSLQVAIHAAAPCPEKVKHQMMEWWGPILHEYYAGTEGNGYCAVTPQEWLTHPGTVGRALTGIAHIVDEEGNELPAGETGAIYFSDGRKFTYHNDPERTAESFNDKGWSTLGDVGYLDEDGFLYLTDRQTYMIISGGVNIYPQEIEDLLLTHPKVYDAAVIGVPNEEFGEEVKAVIQPLDMKLASDDLEAELIDFCRSNISHIKCPRSVDFEAELPRHPTGKLYKRLLKDKYWGKNKSRIV
ncbi:AMP-binding protein [Sneathiella litorea]|uniref:AMP-binding protein n=1 Tax=Sneathiella litorea TaxID=2606216 RepID=A0A6L8W239_9PROT|nr:AMP-binding protein [Sneathiella litorea]MZR29066.1 AMP-binding protein [Sneathiella litorea]